MKNCTTLISTACLLALWCGSMLGQPVGVLDPSFGKDGQITIDLNTQKSQVQTLELQHTGCLLVAGSP
ncbi:MAG: hypothetical protein AAFP92_30060, partial [Bacteroidota bacterium]